LVLRVLLSAQSVPETIGTHIQDFTAASKFTQHASPLSSSLGGRSSQQTGKPEHTTPKVRDPMRYSTYRLLKCFCLMHLNNVTKKKSLFNH
jgi:hypothetical protein